MQFFPSILLSSLTQATSGIVCLPDSYRNAFLCRRSRPAVSTVKSAILKAPHLGCSKAGISKKTNRKTKSSYSLTPSGVLVQCLTAYIVGCCLREPQIPIAIMHASLRNISARGGLRSISSSRRLAAASASASAFFSSTATASAPAISARANNSRPALSTVPSVLSSQRLGPLSASAQQTRTMVSQASKIKVKNPVVELDGDEVCIQSF